MKETVKASSHPEATTVMRLLHSSRRQAKAGRPTMKSIQYLFNLSKLRPSDHACGSKQMSNLIDLAVHACRVLMLLLEDSRGCQILIQSCSHFADRDASRLQIAGLTAARFGQFGEFHHAPWL